MYQKLYIWMNINGFKVTVFQDYTLTFSSLFPQFLKTSFLVHYFLNVILFIDGFLILLDLHWYMGFSLVVVSGVSLLSSCGVWVSHCCGLYYCWAQVLELSGFSTCSSWALEQRLNSCGTQAWLLHDTWDLSGPGIEPMSLALTGGFLTSELPGNPSYTVSFKHQFISLNVLKALTWRMLHIF